MQYLQINITYVAFAYKNTIRDKIIAHAVSTYRSTLYTKRNYLNNGSIIKARSLINELLYVLGQLQR